ncbi:MAG: hypothetical protein RLZZ526_1792 [Actinomycetota bacterium]|jgi:mRNA interferase RelE/StbE
MPLYSVTWSTSARKQLQKLDPEMQRLVAAAVDMLSMNPRPPAAARLRNSPNLRVRVRNHRIIYEIRDNVLVVKVVRIGHRREVYRS